MSLKLENSVVCTRTESKKENEKDRRTRNLSKVEALYMALMCFAIYCLSCITLEAGGRYPRGNPVTKSAAFNALFRRNYNLKIIILVTNIISGLITTLMMTFADRYGIPYLYLPWLVDTMKGMTLCEGPALLNLANQLLPNVTLPTAIFILTTFFLYVEELCIWNNVFIKFQHCWENYHKEKHSAMEKAKERLFATRNKKLICENDVKKELNIGVEILKSDEKPIEFSNHIDDQVSAETRLRPIKSTIEDNSNSIRNQLLHMTG